MTNIYHIRSITELHSLLGLEQSNHSLISVIRKWPIPTIDINNLKLTSDLYLIGMKGDIAKTSFRYGKNSYDFEEGTLVFLSPNQVVTFEDTSIELDDSGWTLVFHPRLIQNSNLGNSIKKYSFFNYDINEALHVSETEKLVLGDFISKIIFELNQKIDKNSQDLIIQNIESILKYSNRYFERQFQTRTIINVDKISKFERFLEEYFSSPELSELGIPTISQCGEALNMSGPYLSDLLRLETGKSALEHIHNYTIERAKLFLLNSTLSISEIAFCLGFKYPQHFSKLFKSKVGFSPRQFRKL